MKDFYVICDNIRSLENIGSIFRTSDALGITKIFLCGISGSSPTNFESRSGHKVINPKLYSKLVEDKPPIGEDQSTFLQRKSARLATKIENFSALVAKTALGAERIVPFEYHKQTWRLIDKLKKDKIFITALEQDKKAISYLKFKPKFHLALIIGNELKGIPKKVLTKADKIIYLPMQGKKESLNVAVAFGVAAYEINKKRV